MCHAVGTASKWYVVPPSIKEAFTTRTYLEHGAQVTATKVSGRKVVKKKHSMVSGDEDGEARGAVGGLLQLQDSYEREVIEEKCLVVSSSDEDDRDED